MASADDLGDALLTCSSVYVSSAAIGLVLGLVLGLNLGLGQLCRKEGTGRLGTLCMQAHSSHEDFTFSKISLSWGTTSHLILKRVRAEVMVRVRVRLVIGLDLWFGLGYGILEFNVPLDTV